MQTELLSAGELTQRFGGKTLEVTHTENSRLKGGSGICKMFHAFTGSIMMDVEMTSGERWAFIPDTLASDFVEGVIIRGIPGRRKFQVVEPPPTP